MNVFFTEYRSLSPSYRPMYDPDQLKQGRYFRQVSAEQHDQAGAGLPYIG